VGVSSAVSISIGGFLIGCYSARNKKPLSLECTTREQVGLHNLPTQALRCI